MKFKLTVTVYVALAFDLLNYSSANEFADSLVTVVGQPLTPDMFKKLCALNTNTSLGPDVQTGLCNNTDDTNQYCEKACHCLGLDYSSCSLIILNQEKPSAIDSVCGCSKVPNPDTEKDWWYITARNLTDPTLGQNQTCPNGLKTYFTTDSVAAPKATGVCEKTNLTHAKLCVKDDKPSHDACAHLSTNLTSQYHPEKHLAQVSTGQCIFITEGPPKNDPSDFKLIRCMITGIYTDQTGNVDLFRLHFYNAVHNASSEIHVVAYWGLLNQPDCTGNLLP